MEDFTCLFAEAHLVTNKTHNEAQRIIHYGLTQSSDTYLPYLVDCVFGPHCLRYSRQFLTRTQNLVQKLELYDTFSKLSTHSLDSAFWSAEKPHMPSFANYFTTFGFATALEEKTESFIPFISSHLDIKYISDVILTIEYISKTLPTETTQIQLSNLSDSLTPLYSRIDNHVSSTLVSKLIQLSSLTPDVTESKRMLVLSHRNPTEVLNSIPSLMSEPLTSLEVLECYSAYNIALSQRPHHESASKDVLSFFIRDFGTENKELNDSLNLLLEILVNEKSLSLELFDKLKSIKIRKHFLPYLFKLYSDSMNVTHFETLFSLLDDPSNSKTVSKCVSFLSQSKNSRAFFDFCLEKTSRYTTRSRLPSLEVILVSLFRGNPGLGLLAFNLIPKDGFRGAWLLFEVTLSSQSLLKREDMLNAVRSVFKYGAMSMNWDLRVKAIQAFIECGFPSNEEDADSLCEVFPGLLLTDSPTHEVLISSAMQDLADRLKKYPKRYPKVDVSKMLRRILDSVRVYMSSSKPAHQRQIGMEIMSAIVSRFPDLLTELDHEAAKSLLTDSYAPLRKLASIKLAGISKQKTEKVDQCHSTKHDETSIEKLLNESNFTELIDVFESGSTSNISQSFIETVVLPILFNLSQKNENAPLCYQLISILVTKYDLRNTNFDEIVSGIFNYVINSDEVQVFVKCCKALEMILSKLNSIGQNSVSVGLTDSLIEIIVGLDTSMRRRGASLPYLALALIKSEKPGSSSRTFSRLSNSLIEMLNASTTCTEASNSLNVVRSVILDRESTEQVKPLLSSLLSSIFSAIQRFSSWDVYSSANQAISAYVGRIIKMQSRDSSILRLNFFGEVPQARSVLLSALQSESTHSIYTSLAIIEQMEPDHGDDQLYKAVIRHISSRISRIRRIAARAAVCLLPEEKRTSEFKRIVEQISNSNQNKLDGEIHFLRELQQYGGLVPIEKLKAKEPFTAEHVYVYECDPSMYPYKQTLFPRRLATILGELGVFNESMSDGFLTTLLEKWGSKPVSQQMKQNVLKRVLNPTSKGGIVRSGLIFLNKHLQLGEISEEEAEESLRRAHHVSEKADFVRLVKFSGFTNFSPFEDDFLKVSSEFSEKAGEAQIALSEISPKLIQFEMWHVLILLLLSDVPLVRINVTEALGSELSEYWTLRQLVKKLTTEQKSRLEQFWRDAIRRKRDEDAYGEVMTYFAGEMDLLELIGFKVEEVGLSLQSLRQKC